MANLFSLKGLTFERLLMRFVDMLPLHVYETLVENNAELYSMTEIIKEKFLFKHFSLARHATDVTFQVSNGPSGNMQEGKKYFSGKHELYRYKIEVSVLPNVLAVGYIEHIPGSVTDLEIFKENKDFHKANLKKARSERELADLVFIAGDYPTHWAFLADKGY